MRFSAEFPCGVSFQRRVFLKFWYRLWGKRRQGPTMANPWEMNQKCSLHDFTPTRNHFHNNMSTKAGSDRDRLHMCVFKPPRKTPGKCLYTISNVNLLINPFTYQSTRRTKSAQMFFVVDGFHWSITVHLSTLNKYGLIQTMIKWESCDTAGERFKMGKQTRSGINSWIVFHETDRFWRRHSANQVSH